MSKAVLVMDKPENCQSCVFGVCKYSHPFWSKDRPSTKGYYCQLLLPEQRVVYEFDYDAVVHLDNCPLRPMPEKKETHTTLQCHTNGSWTEGMKAGWNACIDAITGE